MEGGGGGGGGGEVPDGSLFLPLRDGNVYCLTSSIYGK